MPEKSIRANDLKMARVCENCTVCRYARKKQKGIVFQFVKTIESSLCPFCRAYERVHGRKAHEAIPDGNI
ncbi:MAG TPA: hypothetical protein PKZ12_02410 [Smithellaceae bacterium]|nr:hypothetical protein [Smithellaceae bacterium]